MKKGTIKVVAAMLCVTVVGVAPVFANVIAKNSASTTNSLTNSVTTSYAMGDVNRDGKVNLNDATIVLGAAVGIQKPQYVLDEEQKVLADFNSDKNVDLDDATVALKLAVGIPV